MTTRIWPLRLPGKPNRWLRGTARTSTADSPGSMRSGSWIRTSIFAPSTKSSRTRCSQRLLGSPPASAAAPAAHAPGVRPDGQSHREALGRHYTNHAVAVRRITLPCIVVPAHRCLMSNSVLQQLLPLIGVGVGAFATYVTNFLTERNRWHQERDARWDNARMSAYADYGDALKKVSHLASRIAAGRGLPHSVEPLTPDEEALNTLEEAGGARARAWERVLLLGDPHTV